MQYQLAADFVLTAHVIFVAFVVLGLVAIITGKFLSWTWVHNGWFRLMHLLAIGIVVAQSWLGITCPLTTWEMALRAQAGELVYAGSFVSHWLNALLYYQAPAWVFMVVYTLFAALVVLSWFWVRPHSLSWRPNADHDTN
ncbi:MAG: DUF2784 domain-containing protein [Pseudomonadota bacterium]